MKAVVNERVLEAAVKEGAKTGTHLKQLESCQLPFQTKTNPAVQYEVTFAKTSRTIQTLEGKAHCEAGDAIITGVIGEQWPVQAADFPRKFFPGEGQAAGASGRYLKYFASVQAARLDTSLEIELSDGRGCLQGKPGDWCVWYGPEDASIVRSDVFVRTYELARVPVYVSLATHLAPEERSEARAALGRLRPHLPNTPLLIAENASTDPAASPVWFNVTRDFEYGRHAIPPSLAITPRALVANELIAALAAGKRAASALGFTLSRFSALWAGGGRTSLAAEMVKTIAAQLAAVEDFNARLAADKPPYAPSHFIENRQPALEPPGLARLVRIGEVADKLAVDYQANWQRLVLATTKDLAALGSRYSPYKILGLAWLLARSPWSLISLGLIAAAMLAAYSEVHQFGPLPFLLAYSGALMLAWWRYAAAKAQRWEARHQDLRLLAEWLRAFHIQSLLHPAQAMTEDLLVKQHADSGWVRLALRSLIYAQPQDCAAADTAGAMCWVQEHFVRRQIDYHENTLIERREKAVATLAVAARAGSLAFLASLLALVGLQIADTYFLHAEEGLWTHVLGISQLLSLAFWGAMRKVMDIFGLEQEIQRGELVLHALRRAEGGTSVNAVLQAVKAFVRDQEDWHALHRSKPVEAATGA